MVFIGLIGPKGSGKDTVADFLVNKHGFNKHAFASPLKSVCQAMFGLGERYFNDPMLKDVKVAYWACSPREMLQQVGTDIIRDRFGSDFWINRMKYILLNTCHQDIVISDVRFKNEAEFVKSMGGVLIRIRCDVSCMQGDTHISETEQETIDTDLIITNSHQDGGLLKLYEDVDTVLNMLI